MRRNTPVHNQCETGWMDNLNIDDFNRGTTNIFNQRTRENVWQCINWDLGNLTTIDLTNVMTIVHSGTVKYNR